jgi:hypothetical protein
VAASPSTLRQLNKTLHISVQKNCGFDHYQRQKPYFDEKYTGEVEIWSELGWIA